MPYEINNCDYPHQRRPLYPLTKLEMNGELTGNVVESRGR